MVIEGKSTLVKVIPKMALMLNNSTESQAVTCAALREGNAED